MCVFQGLELEPVSAEGGDSPRMKPAGSQGGGFPAGPYYLLYIILYLQILCVEHALFIQCRKLFRRGMRGRGEGRAPEGPCSGRAAGPGGAALSDPVRAVAREPCATRTPSIPPSKEDGQAEWSGSGPSPVLRAQPSSPPPTGRQQPQDLKPALGTAIVDAPCSALQSLSVRDSALRGS